MNELDPLELAALVAAALERCGVRYLLGGSLASTALGEPRATLDVDIVADLTEDKVGPWLALSTSRTCAVGLGRSVYPICSSGRGAKRAEALARVDRVAS